MDTLTFLKENRMWYNLSKQIPLIINHSNKTEIYDLFLSNIYQYHPISITECSIIISSYFDSNVSSKNRHGSIELSKSIESSEINNSNVHKSQSNDFNNFNELTKAITLLDNSITAIKDSHMYSGNFDLLILELEIHKSIFMLKTGDIKEIERCVFEFRNVDMSSKVYSKYNFMCYKYYESINDYDNCCLTLLMYLKYVSNGNGVGMENVCMEKFDGNCGSNVNRCNVSVNGSNVSVNGSNVNNNLNMDVNNTSNLNMNTNNTNKNTNNNILKNEETYMELLEKLVNLSLISKTFFNFAEIYSLKNFNNINEDLKQIFLLVQDGDTKKLENLITIQRLFNDFSHIIIKKVYYVGLINLCFKQVNRSISFEEIQENLKIFCDKKVLTDGSLLNNDKLYICGKLSNGGNSSNGNIQSNGSSYNIENSINSGKSQNNSLTDNDINKFLLEALGLGLIKGKIDGFNRIFYFSTIVPRCLPNEELNKMSKKIENWRNKIGEVITMMEK